MKKDGFGGANTKTGLVFEGKVDFLTFIKKQKGYGADGNIILYKGKEVGITFKKNGFYKYLEDHGIDCAKIISKKLYPDDAIFVIANNTLFILEIKFQNVAGSTDEKLQTCGFKIQQYRKLVATLNIEVQYVYILNSWFQKPAYRDVLNYIISVNGCSYYFDYIPLYKLGLPI